MTTSILLPNLCRPMFMRLISGLILLALFPSCFRKFIKSDKEIEKHYAHSALKPQHFEYDTLGRHLHYAMMGSDTSKPLVVFIHGAPGAWYGWMNLLDDTMLQQHCRMVAVDRPGYGKSNYGQPLNSLEEQGKMLFHLLQKEKHGQKVILVGRSYGSPIAACLAAECPTMVDGLLLVSSAVDPEKEKFYWFSPLGKKKLVQKLLPTPINMATAEKYSHTEELRKMLPLWASVTQHSIVMQGGKDNIANPCNGRFIDSVLINSPHRYVFFPNQDHFITFHKPKEVREAVLELLGE